jgi:radical SAM superfamily enzyme YgiQ (UPF0313 family)
MLERGLNKRFAIQATLELGQDEELLHWLQRAGCFLVFVGVESVNQETLESLRKASNLRVGVDGFAAAIAKIHAFGMAVSAGIIFGHDDDTIETFRELERFVGESGIDSPVYTILTPMPGTDLWERLCDQQRLMAGELPEGYAYFDAHHVTFEPMRVTASELLVANREAVRRVTTAWALLRGLWETLRRTRSGLAALASFQNNLWVRANARSSPAEF